MRHLRISFITPTIYSGKPPRACPKNLGWEDWEDTWTVLWGPPRSHSVNAQCRFYQKAVSGRAHKVTENKAPNKRKKTTRLVRKIKIQRAKTWEEVWGDQVKNTAIRSTGKASPREGGANKRAVSEIGRTAWNVQENANLVPAEFFEEITEFEIEFTVQQPKHTPTSKRR